MSQLRTLEDVLRHKAIEHDETARPCQRALAREREIWEARTHYWDLLDEFIERARELGVQPEICHCRPHDGHTPRIVWVEGYELSSGAIVSAPPLRYCVAERRRVLRPIQDVSRVEELSLFVVSAGYDSAGLALGPIEQQTASGAPWPRVDRLEETGVALTALQRQLEASLLASIE